MKSLLAVPLTVFLTALLTALLTGATTTAVRACETPVYRYAMYRWQPAPYEIYFLHDEDAKEEDRQVMSAIEALSEGSENRTNFVYLPVDLKQDPQLLSVPPDVKQAWEEHEDHTLPSYLIATPYGGQLHVGELDVDAVNALAESPARITLASQLEAGRVGVFVFLTSADKGANDSARAVLQEVVTDVADGKVSLYTPPGEGASSDEAAQAEFEMGLIEIDRSNGEEKWLVESLLALESDLKEDQRPMVFLVYGRARALLPYIGPGISRENLLQEVQFISGACSCTVKEQNPGVDLLVRYDWEAAAAALAERVGAEEGNESVAADMFFPELIIPSTTEVAAADQPNPAIASVDTASSPAPERVADPGPTVLGEDEAATQLASVPAPSIEGPSIEGPSIEGPSIEGPDASTEAAASPPGFSLFAIIGIGLAASLVVLFGITLVVLRPQ